MGPELCDYLFNGRAPEARAEWATFFQCLLRTLDAEHDSAWDACYEARNVPSATPTVAD